jgi:RluA family pseudouridine synthase
MIVSSVVPGNRGAVSLLEYLTKRFTYLSAEDWAKRIADGRIIHNGIVSKNAFVFLTHGDSIAYDCPEYAEPPADLNYHILYEDEWILGVAKTGNLLVHKSGKSIRSNLVYQLRYCHKPSPYPCIDAVNRLDRETSGVVLFAKDKTTLRKLHEYLFEKKICKEYIAIVKGIPGKSAWTIRLPIGKDAGSLIRYKFTVIGESGKNAETRIELMQTLKCGHSLLRVWPITGRTHQIRVHLTACGLPIVGDKLYGMSETDFLSWRNDPSQFAKQEQFPRQALHCTSLSFQHPATKKEIVIEAPMPRDMTDLLYRLGRI